MARRWNAGDLEKLLALEWRDWGRVPLKKKKKKTFLVILANFGMWFEFCGCFFKDFAWCFLKVFWCFFFFFSRVLLGFYGCFMGLGFFRGFLFNLCMILLGVSCRVWAVSRIVGVVFCWDLSAFSLLWLRRTWSSSISGAPRRRRRRRVVMPCVGLLLGCLTKRVFSAWVGLRP